MTTFLYGIRQELVPGSFQLPLVASGQELVHMEIDLLLQAIENRYGFDFREYAQLSLRKRIRDFVAQENLYTVTGLTEKVLHDPACMTRFLNNACVGVSSMFRDPELYQVLRDKVLPILRSFPQIRIWHAGCSTGEEVYSMAILLKEAGLLERSRLYATDLLEHAVLRGRAGMFSAKQIEAYADAYLRAGGKGSLHDYVSIRYDQAILDPKLLENVIWSQHNLVTDASFNTFHLVMCRNVLIYFGSNLQDRVHKLLRESLERFGVLVLGRHEQAKVASYRTLDQGMKVYQSAG